MVIGGWCLGEAVPRHQEREGAGLRGTAHSSQTWRCAGLYAWRGLGGVLEGRGRLPTRVGEDVVVVRETEVAVVGTVIVSLRDLGSEDMVDLDWI